MDKSFPLEFGKELILPVPQINNRKVVAIKITYTKKRKYVLHIIPVYKKEAKYNPLTEFHLN